jgi:hypothetical protein
MLLGSPEIFMASTEEKPFTSGEQSTGSNLVIFKTLLSDVIVGDFIIFSFDMVRNSSRDGKAQPHDPSACPASVVSIKILLSKRPFLETFMFVATCTCRVKAKELVSSPAGKSCRLPSWSLSSVALAKW